MRTAPGTTPPLLALSLLRTEDLDPSPPLVELPLSAVRLESVRLEHHRAGERLGTSLGMTVSWARTRWIPGSSRHVILPSFRVTVAARCPDRDTRVVLTDRLGSRGWCGHVTAHAGELRIEADRDEARLLLLSDRATITLTISGPEIAVGAREVLRLITGAHEGESGARSRAGFESRPGTPSPAPPPTDGPGPTGAAVES